MYALLQNDLCRERLCISGQRCGPMDGILNDTFRALMDQTQLSCKKPRSSQHHPCFRARINLQPRIHRPRCYSSRAGTAVAPSVDSKCHTLLSALVWPFSELLRSPFRKNLPLPAHFDLRETFFRRPPSRVLFFGRLHYRPFFDDFNAVRPSGDLYHNLDIFSSGLFLLGPYSPLQI